MNLQQRTKEIIDGIFDSQCKEPILERRILPEKIICPDCGGITYEGLEFCHKCGGILMILDRKDERK